MKKHIEDLVDEFIKRFDELEVLLVKVTKEHSDIDKALASWYHKVEGTKIMHVSESHNLIKEVKVILARRREIKIEDLLLRATCECLTKQIGILKVRKASVINKHDAVLKELNG